MSERVVMFLKLAVGLAVFLVLSWCAIAIKLRGVPLFATGRTGKESPVSINQAAVQTAVLALMGLIVATITAVDLRRHLRRARQAHLADKGLCRFCGYPRNGLSAPEPCPECGKSGW